jgi:ribose transport system permease protein
VSVLTAWVSRMDAGILAMLALAIGVGLCIGAVNAFLSLALRVPSFLATLGTLLVIRGLAMTLSLQPMAVRDLTFITFFRKTIFGLPMPFLLAAAAVVVLWVVLHRTRFGTLIRAVGSNPESARLAGIPVIRYKTLVLMLGSVLAALGGLVLAGRTNFGMAQSATGLELDVIAAVVLGGGRLGGGRGSIPGTVLGALLLTLIFTGIAILGLPGPYQDLVKGAMIGLAIVLMRK